MCRGPAHLPHSAQLCQARPRRFRIPVVSSQVMPAHAGPAGTMPGAPCVCSRHARAVAAGCSAVLRVGPDGAADCRGAARARCERRRRARAAGRHGAAAAWRAMAAVASGGRCKRTGAGGRAVHAGVDGGRVLAAGAPLAALQQRLRAACRHGGDRRFIAAAAAVGRLDWREGTLTLSSEREP